MPPPWPPPQLALAAGAQTLQRVRMAKQARHVLRDNAVKHTFSELRTRCDSQTNHVRNASRLDEATRVSIPPHLFFARAAMQLGGHGAH